MAGLKAKFTSDEVTLATTAGFKTLIVVEAAAHQRVNVLSWGVYCRGQNNADKPVKTRLIRCSTAGTGGETLTPSKLNTAFPETVQTTAKGECSGTPFSVQPTASGEQIDQKPVHPQTGIDVVSPEREIMQVGGGEKIALQYDNEGGAGVPAWADIVFEE